MNLKKYIKLQSDWIKTEYLADYDISDYPAISFESWTVADAQIDIMNRGRSKPIQWLAATSKNDKSRILHYPDSNFLQLWVRHDITGYREVAIKFLKDQFGVFDVIGKSMHADHLMPRARSQDMYPDGVTVLYFIPARANTTWGGGHEKQTKCRALKIRGGITLVSVAKSMGIHGPSKAKNRTYLDVAEELVQRGIISKSYGDDNYYGTYSQLEKIENELRLAASDFTAQALKGRPKKILQSVTLIHSGAIKALSQKVPPLMERLLMDHMVVQREAVIEGWISTHQNLDSKGYPQGLPLESVFDLFLSDGQLFPLDRIVQVVEAVLTPRGAVAYLLDQTAVTGGWHTFAKHGVSQAFDYNW